MTKHYITKSDTETKNLAKILSKKLKSKMIALSGPLGSGKTTFVQGFAQGLGIKDKIISPTFVLIRQHKIPGTKKTLYHADLYRLNSQKDLQELGLKDLFEDPNAIVLIEWAEKAKELLPKDTVFIYFKTSSDNNREIEIIHN